MSPMPEPREAGLKAIWYRTANPNTTLDAPHTGTARQEREPNSVLLPPVAEKVAALRSVASLPSLEDQIWTWHCRLGHLSLERMRTLLNISTGIDVTDEDLEKNMNLICPVYPVRHSMCTSLRDTSQHEERDDLARRVQELPPELFCLMYDYTFSSNSSTHTITKDYKPPLLLQVDRASRKQFALSYYSDATFIVECRNNHNTAVNWTKSIPPAWLALISQLVLHHTNPPVEFSRKGRRLQDETWDLLCDSWGNMLAMHGIESLEKMSVKIGEQMRPVQFTIGQKWFTRATKLALYNNEMSQILAKIKKRPREYVPSGRWRKNIRFE